MEESPLDWRLANWIKPSFDLAQGQLLVWAAYRIIADGAICLSLRVMRVLLGRLGFLCLEIVLNCELKHPGTRLWVAEQITSCTTVFGAGAVVLAKSDRFGF